MIFIKVLIGGSYLVTLYLLIYWFLFYFEKKDFIQKDKNVTKSLEKYPLISIIVPCYNEEKNIKKSLNSIKNLYYPKEKIELIIINDGSTDDSEKVIKNFILKNKNLLITYSYQKNYGKGRALNNGLKILKGELFACLDADSIVDKNALINSVYEHAKDSNLAIVTPVMKIYKPKKNIEKFQRLEYMSAMLLIKLMGYMDSNYIAPGPFSLYKTKIIKKLGGFDEDNLVEDQEIAYRAQKDHYKIKQCATSLVHTIAPNNFYDLNKQRNRWFKGSIYNMYKYKEIIWNKNYGDFGIFQLSVNMIAFALAVSALIAFSYYSIRPFILWLRDLYLINFDIIPLLKNFKFQPNILNVDLTTFVLVGLMLSISLIFLYYSSRATDDKIRKYGVFYIIPYFFIYFIFISFVVVKVLFEIIFGVKQKW